MSSNERIGQHREAWTPTGRTGYVPAFQPYQSGVLVRVFNDSGANVPMGGVLSAYGWRPDYDMTADGAASAVYANPQITGDTVDTDTRKVVVLRDPVAANESGLGYIAGCCLAKVLITDDADPTDITDCGFSDGSQYLQNDAEGLKVIWASDSFDEDGDTFTWAFVDFQGQGGGASFTVVQAITDGSAGSITTKAIQLKADVTLSPNFEQTGANISANYFKL